jgi:shikimate kinase / 3-dehydroquinate synthase
MNLILYGPPCSGKTTLGAMTAQLLGRQFVDGDAFIEARWQRPIADYFERGEERLFRAREVETYRELAARDNLVLAPGGGALLNPHNRATLEGTGTIIGLTASLETLLSRLDGSTPRPLLAGDRRARLAALLSARESLYGSFAVSVNTEGMPPEASAADTVARFKAMEGIRRFELGAGSALMGHGLLQRLPELLGEKGLRPPYVVMTDSNVGPLHAEGIRQILAGSGTGGWASFPAGEGQKTLETVRTLYAACLSNGLDRQGTVLAVGGGVVGDLAGFVAATYMRGVRWANLPTTVLAMADASLGGKVGYDLPEGKNLVGAFHAPRLVAADFDVLSTLPAVEKRTGLAEVIKSALIGDPDLFAGLSEGKVGLETAVARAAAVKVGFVNADPTERGERAALNLGHTIGHGIEVASGYTWRHGEAVAVGMVAAARLAQTVGLAATGLADAIGECLRRAQLPTRCAGLSPAAVRAAMSTDKKRSNGRLKFVLPRKAGEVVWGIEVEERLLLDVLASVTI